jgi:hypothetical protein
MVPIDFEERELRLIHKPAHPTAISRLVEFGLPARRRMAYDVGPWTAT